VLYTNIFLNHVSVGSVSPVPAELNPHSSLKREMGSGQTLHNARDVRELYAIE